MAGVSRLSSVQNLAGWFLCAPLAFALAIAGGAKTGLLGAEAASDLVADFERWQYPLWAMTAIGAAELLGALGLLIPRLSSLAACCLMVLMCGAVYVHANHGENEALVPPLVLLVLLGSSALIRRNSAAVPSDSAAAEAAPVRADTDHRAA